MSVPKFCTRYSLVVPSSVADLDVEFLSGRAVSEKVAKMAVTVTQKNETPFGLEFGWIVGLLCCWGLFVLVYTAGLCT